MQFQVLNEGWAREPMSMIEAANTAAIMESCFNCEFTIVELDEAEEPIYLSSYFAAEAA